MDVNAFGNWRLYQNTIPAGMVPSGVITMDDGQVGGLFYLPETGLYVRLNAGAVTSIDQFELHKIIGVGFHRNTK